MKTLFYLFSQKMGIDIFMRQFAWNIKAYFLGKNKKNKIQMSFVENYPACWALFFFFFFATSVDFKKSDITSFANSV